MDLKCSGAGSGCWALRPQATHGGAVSPLLLSIQREKLNSELIGDLSEVMAHAPGLKLRSDYKVGILPLAAVSWPFLSPCRHIENWRGLHTLNAVDMELYTGLQKLWVPWGGLWSNNWDAGHHLWGCSSRNGKSSVSVPPPPQSGIFSGDD